MELDELLIPMTGKYFTHNNYTFYSPNVQVMGTQCPERKLQPFISICLHPLFSQTYMKPSPPGSHNNNATCMFLGTYIYIYIFFYDKFWVHIYIHSLVH